MLFNFVRNLRAYNIIFYGFQCFLFAAKYIIKYTLVLKCYGMTWQRRGFLRGCPNFLTLNQYIEV